MTIAYDMGSILCQLHSASQCGTGDHRVGSHQVDVAGVQPILPRQAELPRPRLHHGFHHIVRQVLQRSLELLSSPFKKSLRKPLEFLSSPSNPRNHHASLWSSCLVFPFQEISTQASRVPVFPFQVISTQASGLLV